MIRGGRGLVARGAVGLYAVGLLVGGLGSASAQPAWEEQIHRLEVSISDVRGLPVENLTLDDFALWSGDEAGEVLQVERLVADRHFLLLVDLPSAGAADRHRTVTALEPFLARRAEAGDRVTVALLRTGAGRPSVDPLCKWTSDPALVRRALESVRLERDTQMEIRRQRRADAKSEVREAQLALEQAMSWVTGDRRLSLVFYLGRSLVMGAEPAQWTQFRGLERRAPRGEAEAGNEVGSVRYLVSLPRLGALKSDGSRLGDRLLSSVLKAEASIYPLFPGEVGEVDGSRSWLAAETGGRVLSLRGLTRELDRLQLQLDGVYTLTFVSQSLGRLLSGQEEERRFAPLRVAVGEHEQLRIRHLQAISPQHEDGRLDDLARGAWFLESRENPLGLEARLGARDSQGRRLLDLTLPEGSPVSRFALSLAVPADRTLVTRRQQLTPRRYRAEEGLRLRIPLRLPDDLQHLGLALRRSSDGVTSSMPVRIEEKKRDKERED